MKALYFCVFLSIYSVYGNAQNFDYSPTSTTGEIIKHQYYTLSYSEKHEQAEWVAYDLTKSEVLGVTPRKDAFRPDPKVIHGSAQLLDYRGSGYDRGHLAPAGDMKISFEAMRESFYLSNISPQQASFNRNKWRMLEQQFRDLALKKSPLYIVTGGVLNSSIGVIGPNHVSIPSHFYKIGLYFEDDMPLMIAYLMPNKKIEGQLDEFIVPVNFVESITGIDFFPALDDDIEESLESIINTTYLSSLHGTKSSVSSISSKGIITPNNPSIQCAGIAKSTGVRCRSKTKHESGYCHHHVSQSKNNH
ncbi:DNA/RNA non-specific endonuclease [Flavobacteriales bacterium]|nr:DNA/RNA non-specific endonuclease [Flavobacteriales bacterium]